MEINEGFDIVGLIEENDEYNQMVDGIKTSFDDHFMQVIEYVKILEPHKTLYLQNADVDVGSNPDPNPTPTVTLTLPLTLTLCSYPNPNPNPNPS